MYALIIGISKYRNDISNFTISNACTNRLVMVGELFRFVRQKVRLDTQFRQNPRMLAGTNENLTLAGTSGTGGR